jgi:tRNA threonylcarbamoyladenosine biosynthesis protein TsaE
VVGIRAYSISMTTIVFLSESEEATTALGAALADVLPLGTVVALIGTLGAGKTRLVQAIAAGLGIDPRDVVSPTFVLGQEYEGRRKLFHFDAYRLRDEAEFLDLGPDEYFENDGLVLIEWADRVQNCLPRERIEVEVTVTGARSRRFEIRALGKQYEALLQQLQTSLANNNVILKTKN